MALLSSLFGVGGQPVDPNALDGPEGLLLRALRLNDGVRNDGIPVASAMEGMPQPLETRTVQEYPVASVGEQQPTAAPGVVRPPQPQQAPPRDGEFDPRAFGQAASVIAGAPPQQQPQTAAPQTSSPMAQTSAAPQTTSQSAPSAAAPAATSLVPQPTIWDKLKNVGRALQGHDTENVDRQYSRENATAGLLQKKLGLTAQEAAGLATDPKFVQLAFGNIFGDKGVSDQVKQYQFYQRDALSRGQTPKSFNDWQLEEKKAGAISINNNAENSFQQEAGKEQAKLFTKAIESGQTAKAQIGQLRQLADLAPQVGTGASAQLKNALGPIAGLFGIDIANLGETQAYQAIIDKMAPSLRIAGSGATSDYDAKQFLSGLPTLGRTPEGNEIINKTLQAVAQAQVSAADIASQVIEGKLSRADGLKQMRDLPDPYEIYKSWQKQGKAPQGGAEAAPKQDGDWIDYGNGVRVKLRAKQ